MLCINTSARPAFEPLGISATLFANDPMAGQEGEKITLKTTPEFTAYSPGKIETCWATVTMTAPFYEPTNRAEIDLVAVIDRSGSMSGSKIKLVQETLNFVVDQRESAPASWSMTSYN